VRRIQLNASKAE